MDKSMIKNGIQNLFKKRLVAVTAFSITISSVSAAYFINVTPKSGTPTTINLATVRNFTFSSGNLVVNKKDATSNSFALIDIISLSFIDDVATGELNPVTPTLKVKAFYNTRQKVLDIQLNANSTEPAQVEIINIDGKTAIIRPLTNSSNLIPVTSLSKGVYICRIKSGASSLTSKFLIQ